MSQINGGATAVPCPDGTVRVGLQLSVGPAVYQLILDADDNIDGFADALAAQIKEAATAARRANSGILLPTIGPLPDLQQMPPVNGHGQHRP